MRLRDSLGFDVGGLVALVAMSERMLNGMGGKILLFVFAFVTFLRPMVMSMMVMSIGSQVIGDGPIGLKFPTAQGLWQ